MAYITDEKGVSFENLIAGTKVKLITENITVPVEPAGLVPRGAVVTKTGTVVKAGEEAYGVAACDINTDDTVATVYVSGEFNREALIVADGDTVEAHKDELRVKGIFLSSVH